MPKDRRRSTESVASCAVLDVRSIQKSYTAHFIVRTDFLLNLVFISPVSTLRIKLVSRQAVSWLCVLTFDIIGKRFGPFKLVIYGRKS